MVKVMESMDSSRHSELAKNPGTSGSFVPQDDGKVENRNVLEDWVDHILDFVGRDVDFTPYTIVADGGNGAA